jgi:hypothetical protein
MRPSQLNILSFGLLLATFKSTRGQCNFCLDGSAITKPDYFVGLKIPFVLNTCKDINDALFFAIEAVGSEAGLCREAQKLGALCGCPVPENACSICEGSQTITKPQQSLEGLVFFMTVY